MNGTESFSRLLDEGRLEDVSQLARTFAAQAHADNKLKAIWWLGAVMGQHNRYTGKSLGLRPNLWNWIRSGDLASCGQRRLKVMSLMRTMLSFITATVMCLPLRPNRVKSRSNQPQTSTCL